MNTLRRDGLITLCALALLLAWDLSGADLALTRLYGDGSGFAWRERWLTAHLLHDGGRIAAGALMLALAVNVRWPWTPALGRAERLRWLLVTAIGLAIVPLFKQQSLTSCPYELAEFGGVAQYVSHWALGLRDGGPGHCFPSGHATSALAFLSGWFALRERHPRLARAWLAGVLLAALAFGWAQMARGAHFASHTLWSAWLCWTWSWLALGERRPWLASAPLVVPTTRRRRL
jgi:membrane-associated PAP2 superfamily phosphatase